jgi:hypothetical protein
MSNCKASLHHLFSSLIIASSSGVKSLTIMNSSRICTTVFNSQDCDSIEGLELEAGAVRTLLVEPGRPEEVEEADKIVEDLTNMIRAAGRKQSVRWTRDTRSRMQSGAIDLISAMGQRNLRISRDIHRHKPNYRCT